MFMAPAFQAGDCELESRYPLQYTCFNGENMINKKGGRISVEDFAKICSQCTSYREVAQKLGYAPDGGGTVGRIRLDMENNNIDSSHFTGQSHQKNLGKRRQPIEVYLNNEVAIKSHGLRLRLLEEGFFEAKCSVCGLTHWLGKLIPLELHHKDGNKNNNNLENLEILCPNCHYFTDTYKSKNRKI